MGNDPSPNDSLKALGRVLLLVQFIASLVIMALRVRTYSLGVNFGGYYQEFALIGNGQIGLGGGYFGFPFFRSSGSLLFGVVSVIALVARSPLVLASIYVVLLSAINFLAFSYGTDLLRGSAKEQSHQLRYEAIVLMMVLLNPFFYLSLFGEFHFDLALSMVFGMLILKPSSGTKIPMRIVAIVALLVNGFYGGLILAFVGVARLLSLRFAKRIEAITEAILGVLAMVVYSALGFAKAIDFSIFISTYAPTLIPYGQSATYASLGRFVASPKLVLTSITSNLTSIIEVVLVGGGVGVLGVLGPLTAIILVVGASLFGVLPPLNEPLYGFGASIFVFASSVKVLIAVTRMGRRVVSFSSILVALSITVGLLLVASQAIGNTYYPISSVDRQPLTIAASYISDSSEVIGDPRLLGRFSGRSYVFSDLSASPIPILSSSVYILVTTSPKVTFSNGYGIADVAPSDKFAKLSSLGIQLVYRGGDIELFKLVAPLPKEITI